MSRPLPGFELDRQRSRLLREGQEVELEPKVFDLLCYLIAHPHRLVTKQELRLEVWQAQHLSESTTASAITKLRRALGQTAEDTEPIETVRGRGYIFHPSETADIRVEHPFSEPQVSAEEDPFVGRSEALDQLLKRLERAGRGPAGLVLIHGPAGIGKTRLVSEFVRRAALKRTPAWLGAAYEGEGFPAYWPWIQVVREAQRGDPSSFARALPKGAHLLSHWVSALGPFASTDEHDPQALRFRLFDELTRCLRALASEGPKVIVLDDLQWADAGSIDLLGHAVRALASSPVFFVATIRDEEPLSRSVEDALSKLSRVTTRIGVAGLTEEQSRALAHALRADDRPSDTQLRELFERSGGNPFFIRQFLEWWTDVGTDSAQRHTLPPGARDVVRRRLSLLSAEARRVLAAASVLGARFTASRLGAMLAVSPQHVLEALSAAMRLTLVARAPGTDEFAFTHALLQETLYEDTDLQTRAAMHSSAAASFGTDAETEGAGQLGERARHLVHALPSQLDEAVSACARAAKAAQQSAGFERANDLLNLALTKLEAEGAPAQQRAQIYMEIGDNHYFAAALDRAWTAYHRAAELLRSRVHSEQLARLISQLVRFVNMGTGDADFARALVDEVLHTLPPDSSRDRGCTLAKKAQLAWDLSVAERTALLDEAAACADDPLVRLEVAYARAVLRDPSTLEDNAQAASDFLALIAKENTEPTAIRYRNLHILAAHTTHYLCAATACDLERAARAEQDIARLAETSHMRAAEVTLALIRAGRAVAEGRLDDAAAIAASGEAANDAFWIRTGFRTYHLMLLEARGAMALLEKLELPPIPDAAGAAVRLRTDFVLLHAYLYVRTGRPERARSLLREVPSRDIERMPVLYGDLGALSGLATLYVALGDEPGMRLVYGKLLPFAGRNALLANYAHRGAVDLYLGRLAHGLGDLERARAHLEAAVEINRRLQMPRETEAAAALLATL